MNQKRPAKCVMVSVWGPTLDSSCQVLRWHDRERERERHIAGPTSVGMKVPPVTQGNQRNHCVISVASNLDMLWAHAVIRLSYWCYIVDTGRERTCLRGMTFCLTEPNAWCMKCVWIILNHLRFSILNARIVCPTRQPLGVKPYIYIYN